MIYKVKNDMKRYILSIVVALCAMSVVAQSSDAVLRDKITNAVMKVYDDELSKNPNDYNTLFARAHQHFYNGEYLSALADVNQAILLTPKPTQEILDWSWIERAENRNCVFVKNCADLNALTAEVLEILKHDAELDAEAMEQVSGGSKDQYKTQYCRKCRESGASRVDIADTPRRFADEHRRWRQPAQRRSGSAVLA